MYRLLFNHVLLSLSIVRNLTLFTDQDPEATYPSQDVVWDKFDQIFLALWGLVTYAPVFRDYFYQGLTQFHTDNVMYLELRALLPEVMSAFASSAYRLLCVLCFRSSVVTLYRWRSGLRVRWQHPRQSLDPEDLPGGHQAVHGRAPGLLWSKNHCYNSQVT